MPTSDLSPTPAPDSGRLLVTALIVGILLVVPTYGMLGTTTDPGLWKWFGVFVATTVVLAVVTHLLVPRGAALALLTTAGYAVAVLIALGIIAAAGDPPERGALALLAGLPAAAIAAVVATLIHTHAGATSGATIAPAALVVLIAFAFAPGVGNAITDARQDAELADELAATSLMPFLPEFDGLEPTFVGRIMQDDRVVGYSIDYQTDPDDLSSPMLSVRNGDSDGVVQCEQTVWECEEHDGYYTLARDGAVEYVVDTIHGLSVEYSEDRDGLPDPDEVGAALIDADTVEWSEIASID